MNPDPPCTEPCTIRDEYERLTAAPRPEVVEALTNANGQLDALCYADEQCIKWCETHEPNTCGAPACRVNIIRRHLATLRTAFATLEHDLRVKEETARVLAEEIAAGVTCERCPTAACRFDIHQRGEECIAYIRERATTEATHRLDTREEEHRG